MVFSIYLYWTSFNYSLILRCCLELSSLFWVFRSWVQQDNNLKAQEYNRMTSAGPVLTSTQLRCFDMILGVWFTHDIPRLLQSWNSFVKQNSAEFLMTSCESDPQLQETFGWGYCWQRSKPVIKSNYSYFNLHCECFHSVFQKEHFCVLFV